MKTTDTTERLGIIVSVLTVPVKTCLTQERSLLGSRPSAKASSLRRLLSARREVPSAILLASYSFREGIGG